jgi:peptidoglycan/xylan/chitin deacetylase (PgdA/CDA1 family)
VSAARPFVPVLTYHSIDDSGSTVSVAPAEFRRQMQALAAAGWRTISIDAFLRGHRAGQWPARTFVLTFDDGYRNLVEQALPSAHECSFHGTVFVAADRVGGTMAGSGEPACPLLDWSGLRELASAGWSVASHACSHRRLTSLGADELDRELAQSKKTIEDHVGAPVAAFAYPYGVVSPDAERAAGRHYEAAFGTTLAFVTASSRATNFERIDAYYLKGRAVETIDGAFWRGYLALRRAGRAARRRFTASP